MLKQWYCQVQAIDLADSQAANKWEVYPKKTRVVHTVFLGRHFVYGVNATLK